MARAVRKTPAEAGGDAQGVMRLGEQRDISGVHHPFRAHPSQCWLNLGPVACGCARPGSRAPSVSDRFQFKLMCSLG